MVDGAGMTVWRYQGWVGLFRGGLRPLHPPSNGLADGLQAGGTGDRNHPWTLRTIRIEVVRSVEVAQGKASASE